MYIYCTLFTTCLYSTLSLIACIYIYGFVQTLDTDDHPLNALRADRELEKGQMEATVAAIKQQVTV